MPRNESNVHQVEIIYRKILRIYPFKTPLPRLFYFQHLDALTAYNDFITAKCKQHEPNQFTGNSQAF